MTREKLKEKFNTNNISYKQDDKWLIIDHQSDVDLSTFIGDLKYLPEYILFDNIGNVNITWFSNLTRLPEYIIFNNTGDVYLYNNDLTSLPENIYFRKNTKIFLYGNPNLKINYYCNYFSKINSIKFNTFVHLSQKLIFEKMMLMYCYLGEIEKKSQMQEVTYFA